MKEEIRKLVEEAESRANKATPSLWKLWGTAVLADPQDTSNIDDAVRVANTFFSDEEERPRTFNASFIAHARQDVPALCAAIREIDAEREKERAAWTDLLHAKRVAEHEYTYDDNGARFYVADKTFKDARARLDKIAPGSSVLLRLKYEDDSDELFASRLYLKQRGLDIPED